MWDGKDAYGRPVGGGWTLTSSKTKTTQTSSITSAEGRTDTTLREILPTGGERMTQTSPSGAVSITETLPNASSVSTSADGTVTTTTKSPDSRYGMNSPVTSSTVKLPSGLTMTSNSTRAVTLSNPADPLSVSSITDTATKNGATFSSVFNVSTGTITKKSPLNRQIVLKLGLNGKVSNASVSGMTPISYLYDATGRISSITQGTRTQGYAYNYDGTMASKTNQLGLSWLSSYDLAGRKVSETFPDGRIVNYTRDANGNITSITPPSRSAHSFAHTPVNKVSQYSPPATSDSGANVTKYTYNLDGKITSALRPDGEIVNFAYDGGGRLGTLSIPEAVIQYTYGAGSCCGGAGLVALNRQETSGQSQRLDYTYDGKLITSENYAGAVNGSISWQYNTDFKVTAQSINGANPVAFAYDKDKLLITSGALSITRDTASGFITGTSVGVVTTSMSFDGYRDIVSNTAKAGANTLYNSQYTRDPSGRMTSNTETVQGVSTTYQYTYDLTGRLTGVVKNGVPTSSYVYDDNGNRISATVAGSTIHGAYDTQDRLISYGANSYRYTPNGELALKTVNGLNTSYKYDAIGNLLRMTLPDGKIIDYVVDGRNRRVGKKLNGVLTQGFLYGSNTEPVAELDGTGAIVGRYVYATKTNTPDYMIKGGIAYRIISDHLGSPRLVVDSSTGAVAQRMDYDEFGNVTHDSNPGFQPFGYAGGIYDRDTKLVRHGARDYDAETGRWTAKDPIRFDGNDTNLYGYVHNDLINYIDISGLEGCGPGGITWNPSGDIKKYCDDHDNCYTCGHSDYGPREVCDDTFCKCLSELCNSPGTGGVSSCACSIISTAFCRLVDILGGLTYCSDAPNGGGGSSPGGGGESSNGGGSSGAGGFSN